jgi:hypothetical protein
VIPPRIYVPQANFEFSIHSGSENRKKIDKAVCEAMRPYFFEMD